MWREYSLRFSQKKLSLDVTARFHRPPGVFSIFFFFTGNSPAKDVQLALADVQQALCSQVSHVHVAEALLNALRRGSAEFRRSSGPHVSPELPRRPVDGTLLHIGA
jgi:hypothetical protein